MGDQLDAVETIQSSAGTLLAIINDILDISKIESGRLEIESISFDLHRLADDVLKLLRSRTEDEGLALRLEYAKDFPHRFGGTGLGLPLSRQLAELMGGSLDAASRLGQGSTFILQLTPPLDLGQASDAAFRVSDQTPICAKILVAEDNAVNQRVARRMLEQIGCDVDLAANVLEGIDQVRHRDYDVVFMDCQMPEMDGFQATVAIRRRPERAARAPIIAQRQRHGGRSRSLSRRGHE